MKMIPIKMEAAYNQMAQRVNASCGKTVIKEKQRVLKIEDIRPKPHKAILLIVGESAGVWDDLGSFFVFGITEYDTMCLNHIASFYGMPFEHFAAGDGHMKDMQEVAKDLPKSVIKHCWNPICYNFDIKWKRQDGRGWDGTTANLGIKVGIERGYMKIVLAGCPMDKSGHWYKKDVPEDDPKNKSDHSGHLWKWTQLATRPVAAFIRSMSGNTADMFGKPDREWLLDT